VGNRLAPALLDRYLARTGYDAQQTNEPMPPGHRDNLLAPVPEKARTHGRFDDRARRMSLEFVAARHAKLLALAAASMAVMAGMAARAARGRTRWSRA
jgi:hypothetical protein